MTGCNSPGRRGGLGPQWGRGGEGAPSNSRGWGHKQQRIHLFITPGVCSSGSHLLTAVDGGRRRERFALSLWRRASPKRSRRLPPSTAVSKWEPLEQTPSYLLFITHYLLHYLLHRVRRAHAASTIVVGKEIGASLVCTQTQGRGRGRRRGWSEGAVVHPNFLRGRLAGRYYQGRGNLKGGGAVGATCPPTWKLWEFHSPQLWTVDVVHFYFLFLVARELGSLQK